MKVGVCIPHYGREVIDVDGLTEMAVKAEEMGFDSVWVTDHIIVPTSSLTGPTSSTATTCWNRSAS